MANVLISQTGALKDFDTTDLLEGETSGGVSFHGPASSIVTLANGGVQSATVTLDAADLAALDTTPITAVAAPGADKFLVPVQVISVDNGLITGNTNGGPTDVTMRWDGSSDPPTFPGANIMDGLLQTDDAVGSSTVVVVNDLDNDWSGYVLSDKVNQPLVLQATIGASMLGGIVTSAIDSGGADFAINDTFDVDGGDGDATGIVDTVDGLGAILTYHLTNGGANGYQLGAQGITATSGIGTGASINVTVLDYSANPLTVTVKTLYTVLDV